MNVKTAFLPLGVQCDLKKNPAVRDSVVDSFKNCRKDGGKCKRSNRYRDSIIGEGRSSVNKGNWLAAIRIYFNFSSPLKRKGSFVGAENLRQDRICMIHASNKDSVWWRMIPKSTYTKSKDTG
jgi:hypothetical protein